MRKLWQCKSADNDENLLAVTMLVAELAYTYTFNIISFHA